MRRESSRLLTGSNVICQRNLPGESLVFWKCFVGHLPDDVREISQGVDHLGDEGLLVLKHGMVRVQPLVGVVHINVIDVVALDIKVMLEPPLSLGVAVAYGNPGAPMP